MFRNCIRFLAIAMSVYLGLCLALFLYQDTLLYHPTTIGNPAAPSFKLAVADAELMVTVQPHEGKDALLYFGGNADDVSMSLPALAKAFPNYAIYLPHYRGYGGSSGKPGEAALHADALAVFDKVHQAHPNIVVVGRSLGTGVAVPLASQRPVAGLVLVTPFNGLEEIAEDQYPLFPVKWLQRDKFESWRYAPNVQAPTLLIAADHDEVIPRTSTDALFARFKPGVATLTTITDTDHIDIVDSPQYFEALRPWVVSAMGKGLSID